MWLCAQIQNVIWSKFGGRGDVLIGIYGEDAEVAVIFDWSHMVLPYTGEIYEFLFE